MTDYSALWREDASEEEMITLYQELVDNGQAWQLEGHVGRTATGLIENGYVLLGEEEQTDYYGNRVPSRYQVKPGTPGSLEYAREHQPERWQEAT